MKLHVTYRCGHTLQEVRYGGRYDEQLQRAAQMLCPDCYRAQQAAARQEQAAKALAAVGIQLPPLTGSEKQVRWAEDIRARAMAQLANIQLSSPRAQAVWPRILERLTQQTDARWWIDRRYHQPKEIVMEIARQMQEVGELQVQG